MKYIYKIFEYPEDEEEIDLKQEEKEDLIAIYKAVLENKKPKTKEELEKITQEFKQEFKQQLQKLSKKEIGELLKIKTLYLNKIQNDQKNNNW